MPCRAIDNDAARRDAVPPVVTHFRHLMPQRHGTQRPMRDLQRSTVRCADRHKCRAVQCGTAAAMSSDNVGVRLVAGAPGVRLTVHRTL